MSSHLQLRLLAVLALLALLAVLAAAQTELGLLSRGGRNAEVQAQIASLLADLRKVELGHLLGDLEGPLALDVGLCVDDVDLLEITAGRLDVEEVAKGNGAQVDQREEEVHAPGARGGEDGREHDHGEVAHPVGAGRRGGTGGTGAQGVDLGGVDPGQRQQREGEEADEEEDTDDGTLGVLLGLLDQTGEGDDETEALAEEADQVQVATANPFNHEEGRDGGDGVDGGEDTAHDQGQLVLQTQIVLEEQGRVVDGGVATGELLEELAGATDHGALELLGLAEREQHPPARLGGLCVLHVLLHELQVGLDDLRVYRGSLELGDDESSLFFVSVVHEPRRRIRQQERADGHDDGEQDLERHGEAPLDGLRHEGEAKDHPVGDKGADGDDGALEADEEPTVVGVGALGLPDGDGGRVHAVSKARDDTADDELAETPAVAEAQHGDDGANREDVGADEDHAGAAELVTQEHGEERAEEAADLVAGGDGAAEDVDVAGFRVGGVIGHLEGAKRLCELGASDEARHHALVVAEQREAHDGGEGDAHPERPPGQAGGCCPHIGGMRTTRQ